MELTGQRLLPVPRERVWAALLDPDTLRAAIPGCESVVAEGEGRYIATVVAAIGPVKARFKGKLQQQDLQPPSRYALVFEGDGGMAGFSKGTAAVELAEAEVDGAAGTCLQYTAQAQIGGRLAQIGSRLIDATAAKLSGQFFERLAAELTAPAGAAAPATAEAAPAPAPAAASAARPAVVAQPVPQAAAGTGLSAPVTIQMPAWVWAFTVGVLALLAGWLGTH